MMSTCFSAFLTHSPLPCVALCFLPLQKKTSLRRPASSWSGLPRLRTCCTSWNALPRYGVACYVLKQPATSQNMLPHLGTACHASERAATSRNVLPRLGACCHVLEQPNEFRNMLKRVATSWNHRRRLHLGVGVARLELHILTNVTTQYLLEIKTKISGAPSLTFEWRGGQGCY